MAYQEIAKQVALRPAPSESFVNKTLDQIRAKYDIDDEAALDLYTEIENIPGYRTWRGGKPQKVQS